MYSVYVAVCFAVVSINMDNAINCEWNFTLGTIKGEVPALTAVQAVSYPEVAIVLHFQCCIVGVLGKNAVLQAGSKYIFIRYLYKTDAEK